MRALWMLSGLLGLGACGGGGTTGTNYSEPPPVATIVATPTPQPSETPAEAAPAIDAALPAADEAAPENEAVADNAL